jgi:hypothetical protein
MKIGGHIAVGKGSISKSKKQIPFTLRLDATGLLTVTVAGAEASAMIGPFQPEVFELSCSTAEFSFTDVIVVENSRRER